MLQRVSVLVKTREMTRRREIICLFKFLYPCHFHYSDVGSSGCCCWQGSFHPPAPSTYIQPVGLYRTSLLLCPETLLEPDDTKGM